jgi:hypothetical protein
MKKLVAAIIVAGALFLFVACSSAPTPDQVAEVMRPGLEKLQSMGVLDANQVEAVMGVIRGAVEVIYAKSATWIDELLKAGATALSTLVFGYVGIRKWRGTPDNRTGSSPANTL